MARSAHEVAWIVGEPPGRRITVSCDAERIAIAVDGEPSLVLPAAVRASRGRHVVPIAGRSYEVRWALGPLRRGPEALVLLEDGRAIASSGTSDAIAHTLRPDFDARRAARVWTAAATIGLGMLVGIASVFGVLRSRTADASTSFESVTGEHALELVRLAKRNSVMVVAEGPTGGQKGSGFVLRRFDDIVVVATNAHVVLDDASQPLARFGVRALGSDWISAYPFWFRNEFPRIDLALLVVRDPEHRLGQEARIASEARPGQYVTCIGNPRGEEFLSSQGHVLGPADEGGLVQHDCLTDKGSSGGPVFDAHGNVVGIHTYGTPDGARYAIDLSRWLSDVTFARFSVDAARDWQESGSFVDAGSTVVLVAAGAWKVDGPARAPVDPSLPTSSLLCRAGQQQRPVEVATRWKGTGAGTPVIAVIDAKASATVSCRANDAGGSNAGSLDVLLASFRKTASR
jgi:S1-C subfamily serine protease